MNLQKRCTLILSAVAFLVMLGVTIVSPVLPLYALTFEVSLAMVGGLISGYGVARIFLDIPAGMMAPKVGVKRFMLIGVSIVAVGALISGTAIDYWMLLSGRVLEGVGSAVYTTTSFTCMGRIAPVEERGKYMGFYLGMLLFGTVSGPALGGVIAETFYINTPFFFYAGFALFSFLLLLFGVKRDLVESLSKAESDVRLSSLKPLLKDYSFLAINVAIFTIFVIRIGVINTLAPVFAVFNLGLTEGTVGLVLTVSALLNFVTMLLVGPLTDRYGRGYFMVSSLMLTGLFTLMIPLAVDMISFTVLLALIGLALGLTGPIMAWVTDITRSEQLGSAMGIFRTMSDAGFVAGPVMLTIIAGPTDQALDYPPFLLAGVLIAAASLLLMRARDPVRQARGENR